MNALLQMVRNYWSAEATPLHQLDEQEKTRLAPNDARGQSPNERAVCYRTLIELRRLLQNFSEPARTTVVLMIDSGRTVHLPTLLDRSEFAFRLILTTSAGTLLGTMSAGDLALRARSWGWSSIAFERDYSAALAAARASTAADEQLLVLLPSWLAP